MKRLMFVLLVIVGIFVFVQTAIRASDVFEWHVDCVTVDPDSGQRHVWVGYTAPDDWTGGQLEYQGNGPGFSFDSFEPGQHDRVIDVITDYGDVWLREDTSMAEITITAETSGPDCADGTGLMSGHRDLTPNGLDNSPLVDPDANSCYSSGQKCTTEEEWIAGWYEIRKSYGLI